MSKTPRAHNVDMQTADLEQETGCREPEELVLGTNMQHAERDNASSMQLYIPVAEMNVGSTSELVV